MRFASLSVECAYFTTSVKAEMKHPAGVLSISLRIAPSQTSLLCVYKPLYHAYPTAHKTPFFTTQKKSRASRLCLHSLPVRLKHTCPPKTCFSPNLTDQTPTQTILSIKASKITKRKALGHNISHPPSQPYHNHQSHLHMCHLRLSPMCDKSPFASCVAVAPTDLISSRIWRSGRRAEECAHGRRICARHAMRELEVEIMKVSTILFPDVFLDVVSKQEIGLVRRCAFSRAVRFAKGNVSPTRDMADSPQVGTSASNVPPLSFSPQTRAHFPKQKDTPITQQTPMPQR
jgi:hypothetical protein